MSLRLKPILFLFGWLWVSLASAATLQELTETPFVTDIKLSPSGEHLAIRIFADGKHQLRFMTLDSFEPVGGVSFPGNSEVGDFYWVNDERVVARVLQSTGTDNSPKYSGELFAANVDGSGGELIFGYRSGEGSMGAPVERDDPEVAWADIIDVMPGDREKILISSTTWSQGFSQPATAMLLDTYTGEEGAGIKTSAYADGHFYTDADGKIRLVTSRKPDSSLHVETLPAGSEEWVPVTGSLYGDYFSPVAITGDGGSVYVLDDLETDKVGLYKLSLDGQSYSNIYKRDDVDITYPLRSTDGRSVYALRVDSGFPSYLVLSNSGEEADIFRSLLQFFSGSMVSIRSRSTDGMLWVVRTGTDVEPGSFYLFDRESASLRQLFRSRPDVVAEDLARTESIVFESFDGRQIAGYFTAARAASDEPAPLVVLVHGGPAERDYWGYDPNVQALATNGFSVLQINYRGSAGYGREFEQAGYRHWGDDVEKDIIAGTQWAIGEQLAGNGNVCIMGAGFGAYAALQSAILAADLFNCVVASSGIYDLSLIDSGGEVASWFSGDVDPDKVIGHDEEELERFSPVKRVAELEVPVMIAHGRQDQTALVEQAEGLRKELRKHDKPFEWFVNRHESSGLYDNEGQVKYLEAAIDFLGEHLDR